MLQFLELFFPGKSDSFLVPHHIGKVQSLFFNCPMLMLLKVTIKKKTTGGPYSARSAPESQIREEYRKYFKEVISLLSEMKLEMPYISFSV